MKTILITGGSGFAGQHLVRALQADECQIHVMDRNRVSAQGESRQREAVTYHLLDLEHPDRLRELVGEIQPDEIYHLAGRANVKHSWFGEAETYKTNVIGAINLMAAVRDAQLESNILIVSSGEIYGLVPRQQQPISEQRHPVPRSPYAASKYCQEIACIQMARSMKGKVVIARPFNHIGPGQRLGFVTADFACQVAKIEKHQQEPVIRVGNLESYRDFSDVRDTVRGYICALRSGKNTDIINVCSEKSYRIKDFLEYFLSQSPLDISVEIDQDRFRPVDIPELRGSKEYLNRISGWTPTYDIFSTLAEILEYWRDQIT